MLERIRTAIAEQRHLAFTYLGLPRIVTPWLLGTTKAGLWRMRAALVGGHSSSGHAGDGRPRLFDAAVMFEVTVLFDRFEVPGEYRRDDRAFTFIDTAL
ncbi:hypothetical protein AB0O34_33765 [Sphaerisporangium sp. NPDC088356]|uniref:hypothetical protein n=1 Tax=Sphaerisporangium sp. NPDC088356 TaxID=3154871 RepID=UPI003433B08F